MDTFSGVKQDILTTGVFWSVLGIVGGFAHNEIGRDQCLPLGQLCFSGWWPPHVWHDCCPDAYARQAHGSHLSQWVLPLFWEIVTLNRPLLEWLMLMFMGFHIELYIYVTILPCLVIWPHGLWDLDMIDSRDFVSLGTSFNLSRPYLRSELDGICLITPFALNCTAVIKCLLRTLCRFLTSVRWMSPHFLMDEGTWW